MRYFLFLMAAFLLFASCARAPAPPSTKPSVIVSLAPYVYFIERIAGDTLTAAPLIPVGSNPHLFEPTPRQVKAMHEAKLWIRCKEPFEKKILKVASEQNPTMAIVDLFAVSGEEEDRHFWLSPKLAREHAQSIAEVLIALSPQHEALYRENLKNFLLDLESIDKEISFLLAPLKGQAILTSHPAFEYFCRDYGLVQIAIECEGKDPLPQDLEETLRTAKEHQIACVLLQPQHNNKGAQLMANHLHLPVEEIDPYAPNYLSNLRMLAYLVRK
jgi:zinc transport system substrate-binding protein